MLSASGSPPRDVHGTTKRRWGQIAGYAVGAVCLGVFLLYFFDWEQTKRALSGAHAPGFCLAAGLFVATLCLRAARWTYVLRCLEPISWQKGCHTFFVSQLANTAMPVRFGELLRLVIAKRAANVSYASSTAATLVDRLTFLLLILLCLCFTPLAGFKFAGWSARFVPFLAGFAVLCIVVFLLGNRVPALLRRCAGWLLVFLGSSEEKGERILGGRVARFAENVLARCHMSSFGISRILLILLLALVAITIDGGCNYFLLTAFGVPLTYPQALLGACLMNILFFLPSPPGQVGTAEMYPILIFSLGLGLPSEGISTAAILWHGVTVAIIVVLGIHSSISLGLKLRTLLRSCREESANPEEYDGEAKA